MYFHFLLAPENNLIYKTAIQPSLTAVDEIVSIFNLLICVPFFNFKFFCFFRDAQDSAVCFSSSVHHHFNYMRFKPLYLNIIMSSAYVCNGFGDHIYAFGTS